MERITRRKALQLGAIAGGSFLLPLGLQRHSLADSTYTVPSSNRVDINLNSSWKFTKGDVSGAEGNSFDDSGWENINVPHTWNNIDGQNGQDNYYKGKSWYRKHFNVDSSYSGRKFWLQFDGSNLVTNVYINGNFIGQHTGGFAAFRFDATPYINVGGDNVVAVKINNSVNTDIAPLSGGFIYFGGLYRDVHLVVTDKLSMVMLDYGSSGVYLQQTNVSSSSADLQVRAKVFNDNSTAKITNVNVNIVDANNTIVNTLTANQTISANSEYDFALNTTITNPRLWNGKSDPYLYRVYVEVRDDATVTDLISQPLGLRNYTVDANNGFYLNGRSYDLHGANRHQDRLNKGWAIGNSEHLEDFNLMQEVGCTMVRCSHYQHAQYFMDLCDLNGMVAWAEIPLINYIADSQSFTDNCNQQLTELIRQNYNHPSILFWSVANEPTNEPGPDPTNLLGILNDVAHSEDNTRLTTLASQYPNYYSTINDKTDVTGFNLYYGWYDGVVGDLGPWLDAAHNSYPARKMGVSEYGAGASINFHSNNPQARDHTEEYQNYFHESYWKALNSRSYLWSKIIWCMFDFALEKFREGDTPGRNDKGLVTYDRQTRKDAFYYYKANWTSAPFVYITSRRFVNRSKSLVDVKIYSNCDSVELKVNGGTQGSKTSSDRIFQWTGVNLSLGSNTINVVGTKGGNSFTDNCTWNYDPSFPQPLEAQPTSPAINSGPGSYPK